MSNGNNPKQKTPKRPDTITLILICVALLLAVLAWRQGGLSLALEGLRQAGLSLWRVTPLLLAAFLVAGLTQTLVTQEFVQRWLGVSAGWRGILLAGLGLLGMVVPEEWGGAGADTLTHALAIEEIAAGDGACSTIMAVHNSVACLPVLNFGSAEQKERFLRPLATGEMLGAFALTEPGAGSDAGAIRTRAAKRGIWSTESYSGNFHFTSFHANAAGDDRENVNGEYLRLCNITTQPQSLDGFRITDATGASWDLPGIIVPAGHTVKIHSGRGDNQADPTSQLAIFLGSPTPIWNNKEDRATLFDRYDAVVDTRLHTVQRATP